MKTYWQVADANKYMQFSLHLNLLHDQEKQLERLYLLPENILRGANLIFGSIYEMRRQISEAELRNKITQQRIQFVIKIDVVTSEVRVYEWKNGNPVNFYHYALSHGFFGRLIHNHPITNPG